MTAHDLVRRLKEKTIEKGLRTLKKQEESLLSDAENEGRREDVAILQQKGIEIHLKLRGSFENAMQMTSPNREEQ